MVTILDFNLIRNILYRTPTNCFELMAELEAHSFYNTHFRRYHTESYREYRFKFILVQVIHCKMQLVRMM